MLSKEKKEEAFGITFAFFAIVVIVLAAAFAVLVHFASGLRKKIKGLRK